tara:strand:- start:739 stop:924 length:186 start_codon:yes stop_codon:yes gene_type:complete
MKRLLYIATILEENGFAGKKAESIAKLFLATPTGKLRTNEFETLEEQVLAFAKSPRQFIKD